MLHVYACWLWLPLTCRPCHVTRIPGMTMLSFHPAADLAEIIAHSFDILTDEEIVLYRQAYPGLNPYDRTIPASFYDSFEIPYSLMTAADRENELRRTG